MSQPLLILNEQQIESKVQRMAWQLYEMLYGETDILLLGVAGTGLTLARTLAEILATISSKPVPVFPVIIDKKNPSQYITLEASVEGKAVVLVDDVADSGRTLLYTLRPLLHFMPARIIIAVLVDRKHKRFPVAPDVVGHSLSTTLQDHISVTETGGTITAVYLQ